jgi:hypothetical protein
MLAAHSLEGPFRRRRDWRMGGLEEDSRGLAVGLVVVGTFSRP